ncbi:nuclear pore complex protein Nup153 isoform X2 [Girardinichthys multiradiatus]|uniref:nuclear pore complex protein Nup153 isoform X2 n=1 Tax=Girardinichthys multiradiatus TaxID=208333 RepID=UPI001FAE2A0D|nr:nuclear pore complex protein Nup153 isoform X2 [Girardinichthys multiradiatus]
MTAIRRRNIDRHSDERAMAATGGGKIRSRRYHIASKPYAKSKQSGLISRVTDTVKSIVPSWLQKYFKNGDAPTGETGQGTEQNCQPPPTPPPNGNEEAPRPIDGLDSPEPSTSNTEPSTSRASLNFQDYVLSRPPLSRAHLHFTPLDASSPTMGASSSLFSQPSTSTAPGPFSTGFSLVKEIKDNLSQHEDDNISTTSGFSSRASDKDVPTSKTASLPQLWSPEMDRTNSGPQQSQSSVKKPSFNLSVFGNSSNSTLNSTLLNSSQLGDSPFYPGKTTYGGAAAVRSCRSRPGTPYQAPVRRLIKAKPAGAQPCGVTSATARRILQSLERMSSPLADAKRIPAAAAGWSSRSPSVDVMNQDVSRHQSKKKRMDSNLPPVQKLVVPAAASVSEHRSVSFRPTLTPGGLIRTLDRTPREKTPTRQSPQLPEATPGPSQSTRRFSDPAYPLSSTPATSSLSSGGGKIRRERTTARPSSKHPEEDEVAEVPVLPSISLPINKSSLPTFSFSPSLPPSTTSVSSNPSFTSPPKERVANKDPPKVSSTSPCTPFTFSSPIVKATAASPPSYSPSVGFTFSAPVAKLAPSMSNGKLTAPTATAVKAIASKSTEEFEGPFKPAKSLKQGSVLDLLKSPGFASPLVQNSPGTNTPSQQTSTQPTTSPSAGTSSSSSLPSSTGFGGLFSASAGWSCEVCLVQNKQSEIKCVCCQAPKPNPSPKSAESKKSPANAAGLGSSSTSTASTALTTTGFSPIFSKPAGTWDCDTCLVSNKPDAVKCVACETAKPGTGLKPSLTFSPVFSAAKTASTPSDPVFTGISGFGDKFKKPEGAWECETCLIQNKAEDTKCVACMAAKPGTSAAVSSAASSAPVFGLLDKFKQPEGAWECDVCLVQNKAADVKCVACQSTKPGAKVEPKAFGSFGSSAAGASGTSTFGSSTSTAGGFKFGTSDSTAGSGSFKFGTSEPSSSSSSGGFKFGASFGSASSESSKDTSAASGFKFGGSSEGFKFGGASNDDKKSELPATGAGFKFGGSSEVAFGSGSSSTESNSSAKGGFTFGLPKPAEKTPETNTSSSSVTLTPLSSSQENGNKAVSSNDTTSTNTNPTTTVTSKGSVFGRLGEPGLASSTPQVSSTFGSLQAGKEPAAQAFAFEKPEEKREADPSPAPLTFVFGATKKEPDPAPASSGGFSFSKPRAPTEQPPPAFTFGKPAEKSETSTSETSKPTFSFGQSAADSTTTPKPAFSFMANNPPNATTSSSATPTPTLFGVSSSGSTPASTSSAAPNTFMFGQPSSTTGDAPPAKTFVFGQNQDSQSTAPSSAPLNPAPAPAQPFIFGAPTNAAPAPTPAAPSFNFGAAAAAPSAASSSAPSAAPSPFVFSSAPSGGFGANQTSSFGSTFGSPFTATPAQTSAPAFGAKPNAAPVFGQQNNSTPVFGSGTNSAPSGGFQFGGASAFGATNNSSGVFTFGAGSGASPAPAANPSIAPQSGAAGGGFNFTQPATFNIGSAKSFAASPAGQSPIAGRKIKTAVRRRK